ncbi:MAG: hypothetical protein RMJ19_08890 [Gemmatales bacterium]|nr:hypothetical protein [Gemmatales bacterium]MCS7160574.1 hypothetical protein [Gemmatales bacterium]MDW8175775.1 hypothetical protein [Gemmatales bacterium]MDW8222435.1 hypothetical protein [Gemmatales bacterium]
MAQQLQHWEDEELQVRKALPPEVNNVLSALWSGLAALALALFALVPMITYDWQKQGSLDWAGEWKDWLGVLTAATLTLICLILSGIGTLKAVRGQPLGLGLTKLSSTTVLVLGILISIVVAVLVIQGQFKLGPTPILAGTLLVIIALLPVFLSGLTLSLATVEGVREFFYPPQPAEADHVEISPEQEEEAEVAQAEQELDEEALARSLGEPPAPPSEMPPLTVPSEVIRAELGESRIIRAELDTEAGAVVRAELDEERLTRAELDEDLLIRAELDEELVVRGELDEERLVRAEPSSSVLSPASGPASDIFHAESPSRSAAHSGEIDIERIGDTASRVLSRAESIPESPSAVFLGALGAPSSPSDALAQVLQPPTPTPPEPGEPAAPPVEITPLSQQADSQPTEPAADLPPTPAESAEPSAPALVDGESVTSESAEEIFSEPTPTLPHAESSAVDLEHLVEMEFPAWQEQQGLAEPETPVYLPSGAPEIEPKPPSTQPTPDQVFDIVIGTEAKTPSPAVGSTSADLLFPELSGLPSSVIPTASESAQEPNREEKYQPLPPTDELFREAEERLSHSAAESAVEMPQAPPPLEPAPDESLLGADSSTIGDESASLNQTSGEGSEHGITGSEGPSAQEPPQASTDAPSDSPDADVFRIASDPEVEIRWEPED